MPFPAGGRTALCSVLPFSGLTLQAGLSVPAAGEREHSGQDSHHLSLEASFRPPLVSAGAVLDSSQLPRWGQAGLRPHPAPPQGSAGGCWKPPAPVPLPSLASRTPQREPMSHPLSRGNSTFFPAFLSSSLLPFVATRPSAPLRPEGQVSAPEGRPHSGLCLWPLRGPHISLLTGLCARSTNILQPCQPDAPGGSPISSQWPPPPSPSPGSP